MKIVLLASLLLTSVAGQGYDVGGTDPLCWQTDLNTTQRIQMPKCPSGMTMTFTLPLPESMRAMSAYTTAYTMTVDPSMGVITKKTVKEKSVDVPHANIHSCLQKVGFCSPFVANTPGLATHTPALVGDLVLTEKSLTQTFTSDVVLEASMYTVIAHGRVFVSKCASGPGCKFQYDIAAAIRRTVLPQENQVIIPTSVKTGMLSVASIATGIIFITLALIAKWRQEKVMRFSQPLFLGLLCISGVVASMGTLTLGYFDLNDSICQVQPWVTTFPVVVMFSFLLGKTFRVMAILNNKKLKKKTIGPEFVVAVAALVSGLYAVILLVSHFVNTAHVVRAFQPHDEINFTLVCAGPFDDIFSWLKIGYCVTILLAGVAVCKLTSDFVALFNESSHIAFAIQAIGFLGIVILPTSSAVRSEPAPLYMLNSLGLILSALVVPCSLMIPKFRLILSGVEISVSEKNKGDEQKTSVRTGSVQTRTTGGSTTIKVSGESKRSLISDGVVNGEVKQLLRAVKEATADILNNQAAGIAIANDALENLQIDVQRLNAVLSGSTRPSTVEVELKDKVNHAAITPVSDTLKQRSKSNQAA